MVSLLLFQNNYIACLKTLGTLLNGEFDLLAFFKIAVSVSRDGGIVHEYIFPTIAGNETITFGSVEPFDRTDDPFRHFLPPRANTTRKLV